MRTLEQLDFLTEILWEKKRDFKVQNDLVKKDLDEMKLPYWNKDSGDEAKEFKKTRSEELQKQRNNYSDKIEMMESLLVWLDKEKTTIKKDENSSK